jgi:hypothetical protein
MSQGGNDLTTPPSRMRLDGNLAASPEDLGALIGIGLALVGVALATVTGNGVWDAGGRSPSVFVEPRVTVPGEQPARAASDGTKPDGSTSTT